MTACTCGCPRIRHQHLHPRDYCGTCPGCDHYTPRRQHWWQIWRKP
jgi:hypothetical protein